jgi:hypothetical protein
MPLLHQSPEVASEVLTLFLRALRSALRDASPGAPAAVRDAQLGAISFPQRFGSSVNPHYHFHVLALDGVISGDVEHGVRFHEATGLEARDVFGGRARIECSPHRGSFSSRGGALHLTSCPSTAHEWTVRFHPAGSIRRRTMLRNRTARLPPPPALATLRLTVDRPGVSIQPRGDAMTKSEVSGQERSTGHLRSRCWTVICPSSATYSFLSWAARGELFREASTDELGRTRHLVTSSQWGARSGNPSLCGPDEHDGLFQAFAGLPAAAGERFPQLDATVHQGG